MKNLKKLFATMLCLVTVLCTTATAFAAEAQPEPVAASDPIVAEMTIFSTADPNGSSSLVNDTGHAWISVKNISSSPIKVGKLNVGVGHEITLGTWGNIKQYRGLWYNIESYAVNKIGKYKDLASLTTTITERDLQMLNIEITRNDLWSPLAPCSTAAVNLWNSACDPSIILSPGSPSTPTGLRNAIMLHPGYQMDRSIQYTTPLGYANYWGNFISMEYNELIWIENVILGGDNLPEQN